MNSSVSVDELPYFNFADLQTVIVRASPAGEGGGFLG